MISQKSKTTKTWRKKITKTTKKQRFGENILVKIQKPKKPRENKKKTKKTKVWREYLRQNPKTKKNSRKPNQKKKFGENLPGNLSFRGLVFCFFLVSLVFWVSLFFWFFSILGFYRTVCRFCPAEACLIVFIVMVGSLHHFSQHQSKPSFKEIWFRV